jgi:hypothetical protein
LITLHQAGLCLGLRAVLHGDRTYHQLPWDEARNSE